MIKCFGEISKVRQDLVKDLFLKRGMQAEFYKLEQAEGDCLISFSKEASARLEAKGASFFNWDLLFSNLGPNDSDGDLAGKLEERIHILEALKAVSPAPLGNEFHGSIRVKDLARSSAFYSWLFGTYPKEWTHRYVIFQRQDVKFNFVLLVSDGKELNHDTLYHLGFGVDSKEKVVDFYHSALANNWHVEKKPRTTWRGTPLHELWLKDPDGTLIEIYARLTPGELAQMPKDKEPVFLAD